MKKRSRGELRLGSNVVELLLPQRRPFLMVDAVEAVEWEPVPALEACRHISANEAYFDGHFPGLHIWPGTLTLEGLGQTATILIMLRAIRRAVTEEGGDPETAFEPLRNLERGFRLHPGYRAGDAADLLARLRPFQTVLAVGASAEVKFVKPVFAGQRLDYRVALTDDFGDKMRFEVEACVEGQPVLTGVIVGARVERPVPPAR
jgi:3-hydroxyacyl-[acyl-carrier-protein] dehydratase